MRRLRRDRDESGASLVLTMVFVTAVGLLAMALLTYSVGGLRSAGFTGQAVQATAEAGGALQTAVNDVRNSTYDNDDAAGVPCLATNDARTYPALITGGLPTTVTCRPDPASGAGGDVVAISAANRPANAVLSLGTSFSETGIANTSELPLRVTGSVYSNSTVQTASQRGAPACATTWPAASGIYCNGIFVNGPALTARGACSGTIVVVIATNKRCSTGVSAADPDYPQPTSGLTVRTVPVCTSAPLITFSPGYYDDAVGLSALTDGDFACKAKTFWFQPGVYYFDFHNSEMPTTGSPVIPYGSDVWTFDDPTSVLVGGTKQGWTTSTSKANMPGSCVSPLSSMTATGVQFVFGDDSQFSLGEGGVELCGTWAAAAPPVAVYGATSTVGAVTTQTLLPTAVSSTTYPAFSPVTSAAPLASVTDANAGPAVTNMSRSDAATLRVGDVTDLAAAIPKRAVLESAIVTVRHGERGFLAGSTGTFLTLALTPNRTGATTITRALAPTFGTGSLTYKTEAIDVTAQLRAELYAFGLPNAGTPLTAEVRLVTGTSIQTVSEQVDHLKIALTWRTTAVREQAGCTTAVAGCATVLTQNSEALLSELYVQGTVYLPLGKIDLGLYEVHGPVVTVGIVARAVVFRISAYNGGALSNVVAVQLPPDTPPPQPLEVYLTAWTCAAGGCAAPPSVAGGWKVEGRTLVRYEDDSGTPLAGQRDVTVLSWQLSR